jgi:hypothetical protein
VQVADPTAATMAAIQKAEPSFAVRIGRLISSCRGVSCRACCQPTNRATARNRLDPQGSSMSELSQDFVKACLAKHPYDRPSIAQLLRHPWIRSYSRRRSGRLGGRCHRNSFETVRLPTGAFADIFASRVNPADPAAPDGAAPAPQQQDGVVWRGSDFLISVAPGGGAMKTAPGTLGGAGPDVVGKLVASLSLNRPQPQQSGTAADADGGGWPQPGDAVVVGGGGGAAAGSQGGGAGVSGGGVQNLSNWAGTPLMGVHDAIADGSLTAALIAAGAIKPSEGGGGGVGGGGGAGDAVGF